LESENYRGLLAALQLTLKVIGKIHPESSPLLAPSSSDSSLTPQHIKDCIYKFYDFFVTLSNERLATQWVLESDDSDEWKSSVYVEVFDIASQLLITLHSHFKVDTREETTSASQLPEWVLSVITATQSKHPLVVCLAIRTFISLMTLPSNYGFTTEMQQHVIYQTRYGQSVAKRVTNCEEFYC